MSYTIENILYATDLSPCSPFVFRHAVGIAQRFAARLHAITVLPSSNDLLLSSHISREDLAKIKAKHKQQTHDKLQGKIDAFAADNCPDLDAGKVVASVQVMEGKPSTVILETARKVSADLIVIGSRGHSPLGEMLIGSVARRVTLHAEIPVLLVPMPK